MTNVRDKIPVGNNLPDTHKAGQILAVPIYIRLTEADGKRLGAEVSAKEPFEFDAVHKLYKYTAKVGYDTTTASAVVRRGDLEVCGNFAVGAHYLHLYRTFETHPYRAADLKGNGGSVVQLYTRGQAEKIRLRHIEKAKSNKKIYDKWMPFWRRVTEQIVPSVVAMPNEAYSDGVLVTYDGKAFDYEVLALRKRPVIPSASPLVQDAAAKQAQKMLEQAKELTGIDPEKVAEEAKPVPGLSNKKRPDVYDEFATLWRQSISDIAKTAIAEYTRLKQMYPNMSEADLHRMVVLATVSEHSQPDVTTTTTVKATLVAT